MNDTSYRIMTNDKISNNLRSEERLQMIMKMMMTNMKNVPSQSNALQALDLAIAWIEWQEE